MISLRSIAGICLPVLVSCPITPANADTYQLILRGKVTMRDGSPPPATAGIQRLCSDGQGSAPGPLTNKKGEYLWRMDVDNMLTRTCRLEATLAGYSSSSIDISDLTAFVNSAKELPPLVLMKRGADPRIIDSNASDVPPAARTPWKAAMKAVDSGNLPEVEAQLKLVVAAAPKSARGWHSLGIAYETLQMPADAKTAYTHAIEADPKSTVSYVTLSRIDVLLKDWPGAAAAADNAIRLDPKRTFPEVYLHQAVARYEMKDLPGAEASAKLALELDRSHKGARAEFVMGRILDAKGDSAGASEHVAKYLALDPKTPDADLIRGYLGLIGKPEVAAVHPDLELP